MHPTRTACFRACLALALLLSLAQPLRAKTYSSLERPESDPQFQVSGIIGDSAFVHSEGRRLTLLQGDVVVFRGRPYQVKLEGEFLVLLPLSAGGDIRVFAVSSGQR